MENKTSRTLNVSSECNKVKIVVDKKLCAGCGGCIQACPTNAIAYDDDGKVSIDQEKCIQCEQCITVCPFDAIIKKAEI